MSPRKPTVTNNLKQFDSVGFANLLNSKRSQLGWSTRELANRAKISQPYVVALERARNTKSKTKKTPTPTVDVIAQLAFALDIDANTLFARAMKIASRHVLLVVDETAPTPSKIVQQSSINQPQNWLCAAKSGDISLRRKKSRQYKPADITQALNTELQNLRSKIANQTLGLIFSETSEAMTEFDNPQAVLNFEHKWADVVDEAASSVGAQSAFNICVYKISDLKTLTNPTKAFDELLQIHDEIWTYTNSVLALSDSSLTQSQQTKIREFLKK
ncbi:MAG: helix-turn-helix domain-containing protein [Acidimicrobiaceae bacterium]